MDLQSPPIYSENTNLGDVRQATRATGRLIPSFDGAILA